MFHCREKGSGVFVIKTCYDVNVANSENVIYSFEMEVCKFFELGFASFVE
jgi:hypothetical protein